MFLLWNSHMWSHLKHTYIREWSKEACHMERWHQLSANHQHSKIQQRACEKAAKVNKTEETKPKPRSLRKMKDNRGCKGLKRKPRPAAKAKGSSNWNRLKRTLFWIAYRFRTSRRATGRAATVDRDGYVYVRIHTCVSERHTRMWQGEQGEASKCDKWGEAT